MKFEKYLAKFTAAIATLGTGNSLGPEGPAVELGLQMSRFISEKFKNLTLEQQKLLLSAGAASGVSAGFNAPLAGVFFVLEIIQP